MQSTRPQVSSPRPQAALEKNCYLEHYRDARKLVEVLELFTLISLDVLFFISGISCNKQGKKGGIEMEGSRDMGSNIGRKI